MNIHSLLENYRATYPDERQVCEKFHALANIGANAYDRNFFDPGHFTGSAWIVSRDHLRTALIFHRKLNKWLQPGGHADGDHLLSRVASREAEEETGLTDLLFLSGDPLDLDIHEIPARGEIPAHQHYDMRFLLQANSDRFVLNEVETTGIEWVALKDINEKNFELGICRMAQKSRQFLEQRETS